MSYQNDILLRYKNRAENDDSCIVPIEFLNNANTHFKKLSIDLLRYIFITMLNYNENKEDKTFVTTIDIPLLRIPRITPTYYNKWHHVMPNYSVNLYTNVMRNRPKPFREYISKEINIYYANTYHLLCLLGIHRNTNEQDKYEEPSKFIVSFIFQDYEMIWHSIEIYNIKTMENGNSEAIRRIDLEQLTYNEYNEGDNEDVSAEDFHP